MSSPLIPGPAYVDPQLFVDELHRDTSRLAELDEFLWSQRKPGILLRRPYPPVHLPRVRSRQGGLPTLPASIDWPYGENYGQRMAMHFLAQIDCAELPRMDARLPSEGMLFFFAVNAEEQIWDTEQPDKSIRVHYVANVPYDTPLREPPVDIEPILGAEPNDRYPWPDWRLPGEPGPTVLPAWPLRASRMDTWPDYESLNGEPPAVGEYYERPVAELRVGSVVGAAGVPTEIDWLPQWEVPVGAGKAFPRAHLGLDDAFPQAGVIVDRIARAVGRHRTSGRGVAHPGDDVLGWVQRAAEIGWDQAPSDNDRSEFRSWLLALVREDDEDGNGISRYYLGRIITAGLRHSIALAGGSAAIAELIPVALYRDLEAAHLPIEQSRHSHAVGGHNWRLRTRVNQMLGHPELLHGYVPQAKSEMLCLLQLANDYSIDFQFGDGGQATFWIDGDDLLNLRFDRVIGIVESH